MTFHFSQPITFRGLSRRGRWGAFWQCFNVFGMFFAVESIKYCYSMIDCSFIMKRIIGKMHFECCLKRNSLELDSWAFSIYVFTGGFRLNVFPCICHHNLIPLPQESSSKSFSYSNIWASLGTARLIRPTLTEGTTKRILVVDISSVIRECQELSWFEPVEVTKAVSHFNFGPR